jgi:polysaccharide deacetylase 2 family uncharacterized protein YibQ
MAFTRSASVRRGTGIFGVHPLLAAVLAIVLVFVGAIGGAWLNVSSRAKPVPPLQAAGPVPKPRPAPPRFAPPVLTNAEALDTTPMETLGPPAPPSVVAPAPGGVASRPSDPYLAFAAPMSAPTDKPVIAVVIDDMGLDRTRSQRALALPGPLTLSFLTYANNLQSWAVRARDAGHEVLAHLPMEPLDADENPGPRALTVALSDAELTARIAAALDPWAGYVGVNNHMGSRFTADAGRMAVVMAELKARGLLWLDSKTAGNSAGPALAWAYGVPGVERDVFLDNVQGEDEVLQELARAEEIARQRGTAVAIGHPHDVTLAVLGEWLTSLPAKGLALAPVSEVVRRQAAAGGPRTGLN